MCPASRLQLIPFFVFTRRQAGDLFKDLGEIRKGLEPCGFRYL